MYFTILNIPCHTNLYTVTDRVYSNMLFWKRNQCVVMTGGSGSGKTINTKQFLRFVEFTIRGRTLRVTTQIFAWEKGASQDLKVICRPVSWQTRIYIRSISFIFNGLKNVLPNSCKSAYSSRNQNCINRMLEFLKITNTSKKLKEQKVSIFVSTDHNTSVPFYLLFLT